MYVPLIHLFQQDGLKADVYHPLSTGYAGLMGLLLALRNKRPLLLTEHGIYAREREEEIIHATWVDEAYKTMWIRYFYFISQGVYRHAERTVALFELNSEIQQGLGLASQRALVIPNGVDLRRFRPRAGTGDGTILGAILRVVPIKDVKTLLRAFRLIVSAAPSTQLWIIGGFDEDQEYYAECKHLIDMLNLSESITFTGQVDISLYLPKLDLVVLTSLSEGQPLVMLESMAAGLPIVATDVGSCRELLEGGTGDTLGAAGVVVPPSSPDATAAAILGLLGDHAVRAQMGKTARARVERYFSQERFTGNYRQLYQDILAKHNANTAINPLPSRRNRYHS